MCSRARGELIALLWGVALGCGDETTLAGDAAIDAVMDGATTDVAAGGDSACDDEVTGHEVGRVATRDLVELSGLVESPKEPRILLAHNDSGSALELFALRLDGTLRGRAVVPGIAPLDVEDMAIDRDGSVVLGDIGDNARSRSSVTVFRFDEPAWDASDTVEIDASELETIALVYPDGPHDAETLLVDPLRGDLFIVTKEVDGRSQVFAARARSDGTWGTLERVASLELPRPRGRVLDPILTGGDVSRDGTRVVLRTYGAVLSYDRAPGDALETFAANEPCRLPSIAEAQGEALAILGGDTLAYVTIGEGEAPPVYLFEP